MFSLLSKLNLPIELTRYISEYLIYPIHPCKKLIACNGFTVLNLMVGNKTSNRYLTIRNQNIDNDYFHILETHMFLIISKPSFERTKIRCECGCEIIKENMGKHKKTKKHRILIGALA